MHSETCPFHCETTRPNNDPPRRLYPVYLRVSEGRTAGEAFAAPLRRGMASQAATRTKPSGIPRVPLALIEINGVRVTAANVDGTCYAFDDTCTHEQCSLAGGDTTWEQPVLQGLPDSDRFVACYVNDGRIDAALAVKRPRDLRRLLPLIKTRNQMNLERLADEPDDLRSVQARVG